MPTTATRYRLRVSTAVAVFALAQPAAQAAQFMFGAGPDGQSITLDSIRSNGATPVDREVADDFTATGTLQRVIIEGYACSNCAGALSTGVFVRIYATAPDGSPGALLHEFRLPADDPRFVHDPNRGGHEGTLDISFPQGFAVAGSYFIGVQLEYADAGSWPLWSANTHAPRGSAYFVRDRLAGGDWAHAPGASGDSDVAFSLYGVRPGPPPSSLVAECGEWSVIPAPLPAGAQSAQLDAIKAFGPGQMWAVGSYDAIVNGTLQSYSMAMHSTGGAWSLVPTPSPTLCPECAQVFLSAIDGVAANDIWAGGWKRAQDAQGFLGGEVFVLHYDGASWVEVTALQTSGGTGAWARGIKALAPDDVWFVGDWVGATPWNAPSSPALAMHWNGASFALDETPYPASGTPGWSFDAVAGRRDDLWAVGGGSDGDPAADTYFAHWNGVQWQLSQPELPGETKRASHLIALAPDDVYAGVESFSVASGYFPVIAHYDGSAWTTATTSGGGGPMISFGPNSLLALGGKNVYWNGATWSPQPALPDVLGSIAGIAQTGPCDATAVGMQWVAGVKRPLLVALRPIVHDDGFE